jgi:hypothetical protein
MGTEASTRVVLARKIVGEGTCSQLSGRSNRSRRVALLAREARGGGAAGALAAVQYLGEVAVKSQLSSEREWLQTRTAAPSAGSAAVSRPASIPALDWPQPRR